MSQNCPYCPPDSVDEAWGFSPQGWQNAKEIHDREHCVKCECCGALKVKDILKS